MKAIIHTYTNRAKFNWKSGITVGLVSIPLSLSLAIASGVSPVVGIISAFWGGAVAAFFGGSIFNIVGPTGALSGLILSFVLSHGIADLPTLTLIVGLIILLAWACNFQKYLIYIPGAVIHGFTLGVAFIIGLGQINNALGLKPAHIHESLILNIIESFKIILQTNVFSTLVFLFGLTFLLITKKKLKHIPGAIVLTGVGILLGYLATFHIIPFELPTLLSRFGSLPLQLIPQHVPKFSGFTSSLVQSASVIAFIAIIETLLSAKVANMMTKTRFNERKEILALALANIVSGPMGGIPVTAALARTSLNIKTGGNSRASAILSSITIGLVSVIFFGYFQYLPLPIVAAILVNVSISMVEQDHFLFLFRHDLMSFLISISVGIVTVAVDPIIAVSGGSIIILLRQIQRISQGEYEVLLNHDKKLAHRIQGDDFVKVKRGGDPVVYSFSTDLIYLNREAHVKRLEIISLHAKSVILRFRSVAYIDPDGILLLEEITELFQRKNIPVYFSGVSEKVKNEFEKVPYLRKFATNELMFEKTADALAYIYAKRKKHA